MAVTRNGTTKSGVRVEYKTEYDTNGDFPSLEDYSQTFTNVKAEATIEQLKGYADALMSFVKYSGAPYKVTLVETSELVTTG